MAAVPVYVLKSCISILTGRKHQLRLHCAKVLKSPILGDTRYGAAPLPSRPLQSRDASQLLRRQRPRLQLHCRELRFKRPGKREWAVTAPVPPHMAAEILANG